MRNYHSNYSWAKGKRSTDPYHLVTDVAYPWNSRSCSPRADRPSHPSQNMPIRYTAIYRYFEICEKWVDKERDGWINKWQNNIAKCKWSDQGGGYMSIYCKILSLFCISKKFPNKMLKEKKKNIAIGHNNQDKLWIAVFKRNLITTLDSDQCMHLFSAN